MAITTNSGVGSFSFTIKQGGDFSLSLTWLDDNGAPMNLTGYSMAMSIARGVGLTPMLTVSSAASTGSRIVLGGTAGTIDVIIADADTSSLTSTGLPSLPTLTNYPVFRLGLYDLKYTDPSGNVGYLLEGIVSLDPRTTA
ncbi:hypothetical protein [Paraburkholderia phenoliruptrix]|uniref:hypothetical protein n=1 Tax=Paraburkholderia phenoliruptrix TaxID=252970 RepID=UPI002856FA10|nr:hypothetical protein [Paraburkholderia phenoliruptrix]MDR6389252.1 hypothetical protein [Paraburkholderia phenoliruptrix]